MLPIGSQAELTRQSPSYPIAVDMQVQTEVTWGSADWKLLTDEVERIWAPYGVTLCWVQSANQCAGWGVRLSVVVADNLPPSASRAGHVDPVVGRILFDANGPSTDIALSVRAARGLIGQAKVGDQRFEEWPVNAREALVPRVLGRALAHEIGHYLLQSRDHARTGLMTPSFRPYAVTFGPTSWFRLTPEAVAALHQQCPPDRRAQTAAAARRGTFASRGAVG
jgi:hypothetical protein